jgi:hypothetical protein
MSVAGHGVETPGAWTEYDDFTGDRIIEDVTGYQWDLMGY